MGQRSLTNVTLAWIDGLTEPALVSRMQARLAEIDIDGLLTPAAVEEYLTGSRPTAFPLLQYTERTDRFAQALLRGACRLLVDGLPLGYLAPVDLGYLMTSAEDRGTDFVSASFLRVLALCRPAARPAAAGALCRDGGPFTRRCCRRSCCSRS